MEGLKACWHCGSTDLCYCYPSEDQPLPISVTCRQCGTMGPEIIEPDGLEFDEYETLAGGAWNSRPREEDLERLLREAVWWIRTYAPCGGKCDSCASATRMEDCDLHIDLAQFDAALKEGNHGSD